MHASVKDFTLYRSLRDRLRPKFFSALKYLSGIDDFRDIFSDLLHDQAVLPAHAELNKFESIEAPNYDLGRTEREQATRYRDDIVFVTGRFRSGSTLLWNIFRSMGPATSYYEPFNERRWFDKLSRGTRVDSTHRGVSDYWAEYEGLEILSKYYAEAWTHQRPLYELHLVEPDHGAVHRDTRRSGERPPRASVQQGGFKAPLAADSFSRGEGPSCFSPSQRPVVLVTHGHPPVSKGEQIG